jgi:hypothetical protein
MLDQTTDHVRTLSALLQQSDETIAGLRAMLDDERLPAHMRTEAERLLGECIATRGELARALERGEPAK